MAMEHPTFGKYAAEIARNCLTSIAHASVVFAWLDDPTAYGSLAELGLRACSKNTDLVSLAEAASRSVVHRENGDGRGCGRDREDCLF